MTTENENKFDRSINQSHYLLNLLRRKIADLVKEHYPNLQMGDSELYNYITKQIEVRIKGLEIDFIAVEDIKHSFINTLTHFGEIENPYLAALAANAHDVSTLKQEQRIRTTGNLVDQLSTVSELDNTVFKLFVRKLFYDFISNAHLIGLDTRPESTDHKIFIHQLLSPNNKDQHYSRKIGPIGSAVYIYNLEQEYFNELKSLFGDSYYFINQIFNSLVGAKTTYKISKFELFSEILSTINTTEFSPLELRRTILIMIFRTMPSIYTIKKIKPGKMDIHPIFPHETLNSLGIDINTFDTIYHSDIVSELTQDELEEANLWENIADEFMSQEFSDKYTSQLKLIFGNNFERELTDQSKQITYKIDLDEDKSVTIFKTNSNGKSEKSVGMRMSPRQIIIYLQHQKIGELNYRNIVGFGLNRLESNFDIQDNKVLFIDKQIKRLRQILLSKKLATKEKNSTVQKEYGYLRRIYGMENFNALITQLNTFLQENNLSDYNLNNLKSSLSIEEYADLEELSRSVYLSSAEEILNEIRGLLNSEIESLSNFITYFLLLINILLKKTRYELSDFIHLLENPDIKGPLLKIFEDES